MSHACTLIGVPVQSGASQPGCLMGPDALRTAGLNEVLTELGHTVTDIGNLAPLAATDLSHSNTAIRNLSEIVEWVRAIDDAGFKALESGEFPIFAGGDHSLAIGSVPAAARAAAQTGRAQFVLWLDAHPDFHTLFSTASGNLHGTPVAYFTGHPGFEGVFPEITAPVPPENVCMMGIRSVDADERRRLAESEITVHDMRALDEHGVVQPLRTFLQRVAKAGGALHVSLDVDFLEPAIAPAVGTTVPGGATFREAHLVMEMLCDSGLVTSLDLVELNPFLDERGRTAGLMVDLCASLFGRKVLDRPTRSY